MVIGFRYGDSRQVPGFFLSFLILPELYLLRALNLYNSREYVDAREVAYLALLSFFTSYLYVGIVALLLKRSHE